jgi:hypothetical protein
MFPNAKYGTFRLQNIVNNFQGECNVLNAFLFIKKGESGTDNYEPGSEDRSMVRLYVKRGFTCTWNHGVHEVGSLGVAQAWQVFLRIRKDLPLVHTAELSVHAQIFFIQGL